MTRWMWARRTVDGDPDRVIGSATRQLPELLQMATGLPASSPDGDGAVLLRLESPGPATHGYKLARVWIGEQEVAENWVSIPLRWSASPGSPLFPSFDGRIEFEPTSPNTVAIMLIGAYEPPLGPVGELLDRTIFNRRASRTAHWLVDRLAAQLSERDGHIDLTVPRPRGQLLVKDIMTPDPVTFLEDQPVRAAAEVLLRGSFSGAPVLDAEGRVLGVLSKRDLLEKAALPPTGLGRGDQRARQQHRASTVGDLCSRPARTTEADTPVRLAAREMADNKIDRLIVLDGAVHVGIITRSDILRALTRDADAVEQAVQHVLSRMDADDVHATVRSGVVVLRGEVEVRSTVRAMVTRLHEVDGVIDVQHEDLGWRTDDLALSLEDWTPDVV